MGTGWRLALSVCTAALVLYTGACGRKADVSGHWIGPIDFGPYAGVVGKPAETTMHIQLDIRAVSGGWTATMSREDEHEPVRADRVEFRDGELVVPLSRRRHKQVFYLKLSADGKELRGNLKADAATFPITMTKI
jgi:hypothetical protein